MTRAAIRVEALRLRLEGWTYAAIGARFGMRPAAARAAVITEARRVRLLRLADLRARLGRPLTDADWHAHHHYLLLSV